MRGRQAAQGAATAVQAVPQSRGATGAEVSASWEPGHSVAGRGAVSDNWRTPLEEYRAIERIAAALGWAVPVVDAAAMQATAHCTQWWGPDHPDPLRRDAVGCAWSPGGTTAFVNPPYSQVEDFLETAVNQECCVLALVFARLDTAWAHRWVLPHAAAVYLRRGRIRFLDPETGVQGASAPTGSMLAAFGRAVHAPRAVGAYVPLVRP